MSIHNIIHQQSHLYPIGLSSLKANHTKQNKFMFYCPLNQYGTTFDIHNKQMDYFGFQGQRFRMVENVQISNKQNIALISNFNKLVIVSDKYKNTHNITLPFDEQLISNVTKLPQTYNNQICSQRIQLIKLSYMSKSSSNKQELNLYMKSLRQQKIQKSGEDQSLNPQMKGMSLMEEQKYTRFIQFQQEQYELRQCGQQILRVPFDNINQLKPDSIQLLYENISSQNNNILIFDKASSIINIYDIQYESFTNTINCNTDQYIMISCYQTNKITQLSENILLNSDANGVIKIIDKRLNRIAYMRNLNQQLAMIEGRELFKRQQNHIKFWNYDKTQTINYAHTSTTQFIINLNNKLLEVDLRNSSLSKSRQIFAYNKQQVIANYQISIKDNKQFVGFTTQSHSHFKAYVTQQCQC